MAYLERSRLFLLLSAMLLAAGCQSEPGGQSAYRLSRPSTGAYHENGGEFSSAHEVINRIRLTPRMGQNDNHFARLPAAGRSLCVPVSVASALVYLDRSGFDGLVTGDPLALIYTLAGRRYMHVTDKGTYHSRWLWALESYARDCNYDLAIEGRGRRVVKGYYTGRRPDLAWMGRNLQRNDTGLVATVGYYRKRGSEYRHLGSHTVTLTGLEKGSGTEGWQILFHDPERPASTLRCKLIPLQEGRFTGWVNSADDRVDGYLELEGFNRTGKVTVILEDVVVFRVRKNLDLTATR